MRVVFFRSTAGKEPVRDWLKQLTSEERMKIGEEILTVKIGWPLGMPLVRKIEKDLWEVRVRLSRGIVRVLFTVEADTILLLHAFIKRSQRIPLPELRVARQRLALLHNQ
jgi:phage-related protein